MFVLTPVYYAQAGACTSQSVQFGRTWSDNPRTSHANTPCLITSSRTWLRSSFIHGANADASTFPGWRPVVASDTSNRVSCVVEFSTTVSRGMQRPEMAKVALKMSPQPPPPASAHRQAQKTEESHCRPAAARQGEPSDGARCGTQHIPSSLSGAKSSGLTFISSASRMAHRITARTASPINNRGHHIPNPSTSLSEAYLRMPPCCVAVRARNTLPCLLVDPRARQTTDCLVPIKSTQRMEARMKERSRCISKFVQRFQVSLSSVSGGLYCKFLEIWNPEIWKLFY
jgi:hypothetical protein